MGCNGDCGITVHFPTVILFLWAAFLPSVQLYLAMGMSLLKLSLEFKMPQSCWHNTASRGACVTPAGCWYSFSFLGILALRQSAKHTTGAGQERGGDAQEWEGTAMRGHISVSFSVSLVLPQFTSCAGEKGWCTEMSDCARAELCSYIAQYYAVSGKKAWIIQSLA